ncbi:MAG: UDP-N-acetylmuramate dehydrogenase [Anaerolineae bacterium]
MSQIDQLRITGLARDVPLAKYTSARLGGNADWFYLARHSLEELAQVVSTAWHDGLPVRILGGGANVLIADEGFRGLVVVNRITEINFGDWHDGRTVSATSGTSLLRLARACAEHGLAGMEWAIGVPGTVGGAVVNNAGAHGDDMAGSVADVVVLEPPGPRLYTNADMDYDYRHSRLKARTDHDFVVLQVNFVLPHDTPDAIQARMTEFNAYRKRTQPGGATLGSIFKNPRGDYAGRLIEASGLKGYRIGGVEVSAKHANFIVHYGSATARDYYALIQHVQATVRERQGVSLELEIELLGDWD